jgi:hypothetical protein
VNTQQRLCPNEMGIIAKVIEGEAIIIRLSDGMYFSLNGTGSAVWELIEKRLTLDDISAALHQGYDASEQVVREDIMRLAEELVQEDLVGVDGRVDSNPGSTMHSTTVGERKPYAPPSLHKYQDMADLLAIDPPAPGLANVAWKDPSANE